MNAYVPTPLTRDIEYHINPREAKYDACAKRLISHRKILGAVLKEAIPECWYMSEEEIIASIVDNTVLVSEVPVDGSFRENSRVVGMNSEDTTQNESKVTFDLVLALKLKCGVIQVIIELFNFQPSSYSYGDRAQYYGARGISRQAGTVFTHADYSKIQVVYVLSLIMRPDPYLADKEYIWKNVGRPLREDVKYEGILEPEIRDKIRLVDFYVGPDYTTGTRAQRVLKLLYNTPAMKGRQKTEILEREFGIPRCEEVEGDVDEMCNLGRGLVLETEARMRAEYAGRLTEADAQVERANAERDEANARAAREAENAKREAFERNVDSAMNLLMRGFGREGVFGIISGVNEEEYQEALRRLDISA